MQTRLDGRVIKLTSFERSTLRYSSYIPRCGEQPTLKVPETVKHILVDCPGFSLIRQDLLGASDRDTKDLLCDVVRVEKLTNFILRTHTPGTVPHRSTYGGGSGG
jgi:hypothetical protein